MYMEHIGTSIALNIFSKSIILWCIVSSGLTLSCYVYLLITTRNSRLNRLTCLMLTIVTAKPKSNF